MAETTEAPRALVAADLLSDKHPAHKHFIKWCGEKEPTKRQARKFLQEFPAYRG